jgi:arylsulfatase A-like enzyme
MTHDPSLSAPAPAAPIPTPARGLGAWLLASAALGLGVGLVESGAIAAKAHFLQMGLYRQDPRTLWLAPICQFGIFVALALVLGVLVRPIPRLGRPVAWVVLSTAALLALLLTIPGLRAWSGLVLAFGVALWIGPTGGRWAERSRRVLGRSVLLMALAVAALAGATTASAWRRDASAPRSGKAPEGAPNVLLVVLDTVRADATSLDGSGRDTTPRLAELARRGVRFERAIAPAPWTLPSHASLFTGRWAGELNVGPDRPVDDHFPTLAEYLGRHGYDTAGFVANTTFCSAEYGLSRGFGHYQDYLLTPADVLRSTSLGWLIARRLSDALDLACTALGREARHPFELNRTLKTAEDVNREALAWLGRPRDRPFFVFLNYFDAHDPYLLPAGAAHPFGPPRLTLAERRTLREWVTEVPRRRTAAEFELARDAYDDCLAYLDGRLGRLVDELGRLGVLEDTIVIVTADHGEHFGEHCRDGIPMVGHRLSVHQAEIHVPLLILAPGRLPCGRTVPGAASLRDVPATVVDLLGLRTGSPFPGRSLASRVDGGEAEDGPPTPGVAFSEFNPEGELPPTLRYQFESVGLMRAVVAEGASLLRDGRGGESFYDLASDPDEQVDLSDSASAAGRIGRLGRRLDAFLREEAAGAPPPRAP